MRWATQLCWKAEALAFVRAIRRSARTALQTHTCLAGERLLANAPRAFARHRNSAVTADGEAPRSWHRFVLTPSVRSAKRRVNDRYQAEITCAAISRLFELFRQTEGLLTQPTCRWRSFMWPRCKSEGQDLAGSGNPVRRHFDQLTEKSIGGKSYSRRRYHT